MATHTELASLTHVNPSEHVGGIELIVSDEHLILAAPEVFRDDEWDAAIALVEPYVVSTDIDYRTQAYFDDESKQQLYVFQLRANAGLLPPVSTN